MTIQAFLFLQKLKKVQQSEDTCVSIFPDDLKMGVISRPGEKKPNPVLEIKQYKTDFRSILEFLERGKYISTQDDLWGRKQVIHVTVLHEGWHLWQTAISKTVSFLFRSIAVPILVSILTTVITMRVTEWLAGS